MSENGARGGDGKPAAAAAPSATADFSRRLGRLSLAIFAAALVVAVYAALERRGFYADGANYLVRLLAAEDFDFSEPARLTVLLLLQAPTVVAARLGLVDLAGAGLVYCLTLELAPIALLALCYAALPRESKHFFLFPLLHYLAATLGASAAPVLESLAAAAYFWLLFILVLFRPIETKGFAALWALALPALFLHETMAGLAVMLALAAASRARQERERGRRRAFAALALWFALAAAVQAGLILLPRSVENRANILAGFFEFWWLIGREGGINVPAWLGLLALLVVNLIPLLGNDRPGRRARGAAWVMAAALAALAAGGVAVAAALPETVFLYMHFAARLVPGVISLALAAGMLGSVWKPARQRWMRPSVLAICAVLAAGGLAWHAVAIRDWSHYVALLRKALAESRGLVPPAPIETGLRGRDRIIFRNMKWPWAYPEISIALAPGGKVSAIIDRETVVPWQTWYPRNPQALPRSRFWSYEEYLKALAEQPASRQ